MDMETSATRLGPWWGGESWRADEHGGRYGGSMESEASATRTRLGPTRRRFRRRHGFSGCSDFAFRRCVICLDNDPLLELELLVRRGVGGLRIRVE